METPRRERGVFFDVEWQFSEPLEFQIASTDRFKDLAAWIHTHLRSELSVEALAARVFLSPRQFARAFKREFGTTPAAFVEAARLSSARRRLAQAGAQAGARVSVDAIGRSVGYAGEDVFRRAFERVFAVTPGAYRDRFAAMTERRRRG